MEEWKTIVKYEGIYEVSNYGNIRTCEGKITHTNCHGIRHWKQRILQPREDKKNKSLSVSLWKDGIYKSMLIHRLVAGAFIPNPNNLETVNHKDGNRQNNNIVNLEWLNRADNIRHGFENGLYTCQIEVIIVKKETKDAYYFRSLSKASKFIGHNKAYISSSIIRKKYENSKYTWKLLI